MILNCVGGLAVVLYILVIYRRDGIEGLWGNPKFRFFLLASTLMVLATTIVNTLAPKEKTRTFLIAADTLTIGEADTSRQNLARQNSRFHYVLIQKLNTFSRYESRLQKTKETYERFAADNSSSIKNTGYFGLAVLASLNDDHDKSFGYLNKISDPDYPFSNFLKGEMLLEEDQPEEAELAFKRELSIEHGNFKEAYLRLVALYESAHNYGAIGQLLHLNAGEELVPGYLARKATLSNLDLQHYLKWLVKSFNESVNGTGLLAAIAIFMVWISYLIHLDRFGGFRISGLLFMSACGGAGVFGIIAFNDLFDLLSQWNRTGDAVNDLVYCILMIGFPEEVLKFIPVLLVAVFSKRLDSPLEFIRYSAASALGFAFIENLIYFRDVSGGIIHGRAFLAAVGHMADSGILVYGLIYNRFFNNGRHNKIAVTIISFGAAAISHGIYDFLLYHDFVVPFFLFFLVVVIVWLRIINISLHQSFTMTSLRYTRMESGQRFLLITLSAIIAGEYLLNGFTESADHANRMLMSNGVAFFYIIFYASAFFSFRNTNALSRWRVIRFIVFRRRANRSSNCSASTAVLQ